jgi:hypothetical protein
MGCRCRMPRSRHRGRQQAIACRGTTGVVVLHAQCCVLLKKAVCQQAQQFGAACLLTSPALAALEVGMARGAAVGAVMALWFVALGVGCAHIEARRWLLAAAVGGPAAHGRGCGLRCTWACGAGGGVPVPCTGDADPGGGLHDYLVLHSIGAAARRTAAMAFF